MPTQVRPPGFQDLLQFGLLEAILGRRSRRWKRATPPRIRNRITTGPSIWIRS